MESGGFAPTPGREGGVLCKPPPCRRVQPRGSSGEAAGVQTGQTLALGGESGSARPPGPNPTAFARTGGGRPSRGGARCRSGYPWSDAGGREQGGYADRPQSPVAAVCLLRQLHASRARHPLCFTLPRDRHCLPSSPGFPSQCGVSSSPGRNRQAGPEPNQGPSTTLAALSIFPGEQERELLMLPQVPLKYCKARTQKPNAKSRSPWMPPAHHARRNDRALRVLQESRAAAGASLPPPRDGGPDPCPTGQQRCRDISINPQILQGETSEGRRQFSCV